MGGKTELGNVRSAAKHAAQSHPRATGTPIKIRSGSLRFIGNTSLFHNLKIFMPLMGHVAKNQTLIDSQATNVNSRGKFGTAQVDFKIEM